METETPTRRLDRMRQGKAVAEFAPLVSDPSVRVALVPLTEAEYENSIKAAAMLVMPESRMGMEYRERWQTAEIIFQASRNPSDLAQHKWESIEEMKQETDFSDINHLFDLYLEMVDQSSPATDGISEEEFDELKKVLLTLPMNELSGRQWYALKRFLGSVFQTLLRDKLPGSTSTSLLTWMSDRQEPVSNVSESTQGQAVKSVESP